VAFDLDVHGAAWAEHRWGAAQGCEVAAYVTIGTGIGAGLVVGGRILHGRRHPDAGHVALPPARDGFAGICPFHSDCFEGRCSGPAIQARTGIKAEDLPADHPGWEALFADLAAGLSALVAVASPQRLVLGGSVPKGGRLGAEAFFARLRQAMLNRDRGYLALGDLAWLVPPALGDDAGILGAAGLAWDRLAV
jgi:fructokinase